MKVCPNCQKRIPDKATVCPFCGKPVSPSLISKIMSTTRYKIGFIAGMIGLVALLTAGLYIANLRGWFSPRPSCYAQSQAYLDEFMPLFSQWTQASQNIHNLTKSDIELIEFSMESLRNQISALTPPKCAVKVHQLFMSYMDNMLNGYNAVISGDTEVTVKTYIDTAADFYNQYRSQVLELYPELSISPTSTP